MGGSGCDAMDATRCRDGVSAVVAVLHAVQDRTAIGPARMRDQRNTLAFDARMPGWRMPRSRTIRSGMRCPFRSSLAVVTSLSSDCNVAAGSPRSKADCSSNGRERLLQATLGAVFFSLVPITAIFSGRKHRHNVMRDSFRRAFAAQTACYTPAPLGCRRTAANERIRCRPAAGPAQSHDLARRCWRFR